MNDRRVFTIELKPAGGRLIKLLDHPVLDLHESLFAGVKKADQKNLTRILGTIREGVVP